MGDPTILSLRSWCRSLSLFFFFSFFLFTYTTLRMGQNFPSSSSILNVELFFPFFFSYLFFKERVRFFLEEENNNKTLFSKTIKRNELNSVLLIHIILNWIFRQHLQLAGNKFHEKYTLKYNRFWMDFFINKSKKKYRGGFFFLF